MITPFGGKHYMDLSILFFYKIHLSTEITLADGKHLKQSFLDLKLLWNYWSRNNAEIELCWERKTWTYAYLLL